jgi:hypothetical protein
VGDADSGLRSINREALRAAIGITMLHAFETALGEGPVEAMASGALRSSGSSRRLWPPTP